MGNPMSCYLLSEERGLVAEVAKSANFAPGLVKISGYPDSPFTPWDPVGLPLDPWDPVGLPVDPL